MLTLIYNKHYPLSLSNYRPITVLNTDTKIIAYALAQRFKKQFLRLSKFFPVIIVIEYWNNKIFKAFPKLSVKFDCYVIITG
jgi:PII-like signaling protein